MPRLTTRAHGILDYLVAILLIIGPLLFLGDTGGAQGAEAYGFAPYVGLAALWSLVAAGVLWLAVSLATDYEMGFKPIIPLSAHLGIDIVLGALVAVSPWLLSFSDYIAWPHVLVGLTAIGVALRTERHTSYEEPYS